MGRKKKHEISTHDEPENTGEILEHGDTEHCKPEMVVVSTDVDTDGDTDADGIVNGEPRYFVVNGALSTLYGIIAPDTVIGPGDAPGQIRARYVPGGEATIHRWIRAKRIEVR